ncbi:MAG: conjugal transfer protein TraG N-terminal domain-containing protein [Cocleimonas sp.]
MNNWLDVTVMGFSHMDSMTGLVGAYFYQIVWDSLHACGLTFFPFLIAVVAALRENYEGDGMTDAPHQQVGRLYIKLTVMTMVMLFAAIPSLNVSDVAVRMQLRTCDKTPETFVSGASRAAEVMGDALTFSPSVMIETTITEAIELGEDFELRSEMNSLARVSSEIRMGGNVVKVPIWWHFWRQMSLAVGSLITSKIPCDNGMRAYASELETHFIRDPILAEDLSIFMAQCTLRANQIERKIKGNTPLTEASMLPNYPFYQTESFYGSIRTSKAVWGFGNVSDEKGYDPKTAPNSSNPSGTPPHHGYPLCLDWWDDTTLVKDSPTSTRTRKLGLEDRLFDYYELTDPSKCGIFATLYGIASFGAGEYDSGGVANCDFGEGNSQQAVLTGILRMQLLGQGAAAVEARKIQAKHMGAQALLGSQNTTAESSEGVSKVLDQMLSFGLLTSAVSDFSGNLALLKAMPAATSMLILIITAMLPLGMIVSRYEIEPLLGLTLMYCGFFLWIPYFRMIKWLDDHLVSMLVASTQVMSILMLETMIAVAYVGVVTMMGAVFTVAGVRIAQLDPIGGDKMGSIANKGAKGVQNIASKGLSPIKGKMMGK